MPQTKKLSASASKRSYQRPTFTKELLTTKLFRRSSFKEEIDMFNLLAASDADCDDY